MIGSIVIFLGGHALAIDRLDPWLGVELPSKPDVVLAIDARDPWSGRWTPRSTSRAECDRSDPWSSRR
jgi:hypothetical protein